MMVMVANIVWFALATILFLLVRKLIKTPAGVEAVRRIKSRPVVLGSLFVIGIFFTVGFLDQIKIPDETRIRSRSLIDLLFQSMPQERTYSAPFAKTVTGVDVDEDNPKEKNRVQGVHLLGTDINGYDMIYNLSKGAGTALLLSFGTSFISIPIGIFLGILAGYFGGWIDDVIQWLYTTVASIPWLLFVIAFLMVFGRGLFWIIVAIGITAWVDLARLIRGETLKIKNLDYVTAAHATGTPHPVILFRHILPNLGYLIVITFTLAASNVILAESILTFIGIGVEPGTTSWGVMLVEAQKELTRDPPIWWVFVGASFAGIMPLVLALNLFGDALRDAFDPRLRGEE